ncbi:hypothetical protein BGZ95_008782, partial [Linnemannia exigua]
MLAGGGELALLRVEVKLRPDVLHHLDGIGGGLREVKAGTMSCSEGGPLLGKDPGGGLGREEE